MSLSIVLNNTIYFFCCITMFNQRPCCFAVCSQKEHPAASSSMVFWQARKIFHWMDGCNIRRKLLRRKLLICWINCCSVGPLHPLCFLLCSLPPDWTLLQIISSSFVKQLKIVNSWKTYFFKRPIIYSWNTIKNKMPLVLATSGCISCCLNTKDTNTYTWQVYV